MQSEKKQIQERQQQSEPRPDPRFEMILGKPKSDPECKYAEIYSNGVGWALYCRLLDRFLTKYEIPVCIERPSSCPIKRLFEHINEL
jgi:hypothetical protein